MRIVIDLQGAQASNRFRGIGRYSLALTQAIARHAGDHDIWIALNGFFSDTIESLRAALDNMIPQERIVVWKAPSPITNIDYRGHWRREAGELLREAFLASLKPDVLHLSSLFEGLDDNALTTIGMFENVPTAVTLYDLIPLIHGDLYLANPRVKDWYERKLGNLRRAGLWLAISGSSRQEGIDWLGLPEEWVVNVSAAADVMFQPMLLSAEKARAIRNCYGLTRPFVMYTGGIDHRKNIEGLIRAYAKLPTTLRAGYQMVIVCSASKGEISSLMLLAARCNLAPDEVLFTGFVPDADLVALYNLCAAFVFPSLHEGFGLPALEAMACGAAVIGANTSSIPEVIGCADALFDPHRETDMTAKLYTVLTNGSFRDKLKRHGLEQAKKFSWDYTACRTLESFERLYAHSRATPAVSINVPASFRPRLAYVSPLPPQQSGIATYSAQLLPELDRHYKIDVIIEAQELTDPWIRANCATRSVLWFDQNAHRYDRILYHFGNSVFHQHMFNLLERHPGTVVLHDFFLSGVKAYMDVHGYSPGAWASALYSSHGYHAIAERFTARDTADVVWKYPTNISVLQQAQGVIVHSHFSLDLADRWYGKGFSIDWKCIPLLRKAVTRLDRDAARLSLGFKPEDFLVCAFGIIGQNKLNHRLLSVWLASPLALNPNCHLVFVGENLGDEYGANLLRMISRSEAAKRVRITGFVPQVLYESYLASADAAVQLRTLSRGETSSAVLDCMNYGLPTIVNAHASMAELAQDCILRLPDEFSDVELREALLRIYCDPILRQELGKRAQAEIRTHHHPRNVANQFREAIEHFFQAGPHAIEARLVRAIAMLDGSPAEEQEWVSVAQALAVNHPSPRGLKQLLIDISELVQRDAKSGIQRMVRSVLNEVLKNPPEGFRIEPVYASENGIYRYARRFTMKLLHCPDVGFVDEPMEAVPGDIFLGLDFSPHVVPRYAEMYAVLRQRGVGIFFVVHDLLCVTHPDWFFEGAFENFSGWLRHVVELGDGAVCVSRTTAEELAKWLKRTKFVRQRPFKIGYSHNGADIDASLPTDGVTDNFNEVLKQLRQRPSVLMVGTVEPRKGYGQSLAAFELLWDAGVEVNLVIVGKPGWKMDVLIERLRHHQMLHQRLFWFEGATDEMLRQLYETADGLLMASEGEGFGLPLVEAAQYKLPILVRDIPIFREVAGEHASYFSGITAESLVEVLRSWIAALDTGSAPKSDVLPYLTWEQSARNLFDIILKNQWYLIC